MTAWPEPLRLVPFDAPEVERPANYAQSVRVEGARRFLFISGQVPVARDGSVPDSFVGQARLVWANLLAQAEAAGMGADNLVKVTTFLSDRRFANENRAVREAVLGPRRIALTVVICGIFDPDWMLEIEAVAAA
jgi:enamine deaminase RidA (YjgF/YER057c/UK114 family)